MMERDGMVLGMPEDEYHSGPEISASALKVYRSQTPAHFNLYRQGKLKKDSPSFKFGRNAHCRLLEPDRWATKTVIGPEVRRNSKEWKAFELEHPGKEILKPSEDVYGEMVERSRASSKSFRWFLDTPGKTEVSFFWTDPETGLRCRCRVDKLIEIDGGKLLAGELKTTSDLSLRSWCRDAEKYGYHVQEAFYRRGIKQVTGRSCDFCFPIIEDKSYLSAVRQLADRAVDKADLEISIMLKEISAREQLGDWPGYGDEVEIFDLPEYYYNDEEWL